MYIDNQQRRIALTEQEIIDAIALYLRDQHGFDPRSLQVELHYDERSGFGSFVLF